MTDAVTIPGLAVVDGRELPKACRKLLRPGETVTDTEGRDLTLPTHFYEIDSWEQARETEMAPNFGLYEFISIDVREADLLRSFPRYVPLALAHLAAHLALLRSTLGTYVHVAANGGYRSPTHHVGPEASAHCWGTAANIYRIGDDYLDTDEAIAQYTDIVRSTLPAANIRPFGRWPGGTIDHLHVDLGRYVLSPEEPYAVENG